MSSDERERERDREREREREREKHLCERETPPDPATFWWTGLCCHLLSHLPGPGKWGTWERFHVSHVPHFHEYSQIFVTNCYDLAPQCPTFRDSGLWLYLLLMTLSFLLTRGTGILSPPDVMTSWDGLQPLPSLTGLLSDMGSGSFKNSSFPRIRMGFWF